jgi:hypothetical protein
MNARRSALSKSFDSQLLVEYGACDQGKMVAQFPSKNTCDRCYIAIRSMLDKSYLQLSGRTSRASSPSSRERPSGPRKSWRNHRYDFVIVNGVPL